MATVTTRGIRRTLLWAGYPWAWRAKRNSLNEIVMVLDRSCLLLPQFVHDVPRGSAAPGQTALNRFLSIPRVVTLATFLTTRSFPHT